MRSVVGLRWGRVLDPGSGRAVAAVTSASTGAGSSIHGDRHWRAVGLAALELAPRVAGADAGVALLFALFHDSMRENDGDDPEHGARGAALAGTLHGGPFALAGPQLAVLLDACTRHADGERSDDPTTALCWDADRLNLWRVGKEPDPRLLSTDTARDPGQIERACGYHSLAPGWPELFDRFASVL